MHSEKSKSLFLSAGFSVIALIVGASTSWSQTPSPTAPAVEDGYEIISSIETGVRGLAVNGDVEKFRSDLNYHPGLRTFDSSFLSINHNKGFRYYDTLLIKTSGWGADRSGSTLFNVDKTGMYKFESNVRSVKYYNNLKTHAFNWSAPFRGSEHRMDTRHTFGDFDFTLFPERESFRVRFGYSFNRTHGPGAYTIRFPAFSSPTTTTRGDEFEVNSLLRSGSQDFRAGVEGQLLGFNMGLNYGHRIFRDRTQFNLDFFSPGNNPDPNTATINRFYRLYPVRGTTDHVSFNVQRTFGDRLDFVGRFIYAVSKSVSNEGDTGVGTSSASGSTAPRILVDLDEITVRSETKRPQARADVGLTYRATDRFRISNTFNFDQFNISGGNRFFEFLISRTATGVPRPNDFSSTAAWRATSYRRFTNTIEGDYQFSHTFAFHAGYRYGHRRVALGSQDRNLRTGVVGPLDEETFDNTTHTLLLGMKYKPADNWAIFADFDRGTSDNAFTRLANSDFTNFRVRSITNLKTLTFNLSAIVKDNDNPGVSEPVGTLPAIEAVANTKTRFFSGSVEWAAKTNFNVSAGYTYNYQKSNVDIIVPIGPPIVTPTQFRFGISQYYMKDSYFFFDVTARPFRRMSLYASYRIDNDPGQGDRVSTRPEDFITSYPIKFQMPEIKMAIRLTRNIDWNLGYQYYSYRETPKMFPFVAQNYTAHMPYTSLRFYWGTRAAER